MSEQYANNGKKQDRNGKDKLNYAILKELYSLHGSNLFKNGSDNSVIETIMKYTFTEEDKIKAREAGEGYAIAMFSAKLSLSAQKKIILNALFESLKNESLKSSKSIETLIDEKITGQMALF